MTKVKTWLDAQLELVEILEGFNKIHKQTKCELSATIKDIELANFMTMFNDMQQKDTNGSVRLFLPGEFYSPTAYVIRYRVTPSVFIYIQSEDVQSIKLKLNYN